VTRPASEGNWRDSLPVMRVVGCYYVLPQQANVVAVDPHAGELITMHPGMVDGAPATPTNPWDEPDPTDHIAMPPSAVAPPSQSGPPLEHIIKPPPPVHRAAPCPCSYTGYCSGWCNQTDGDPGNECIYPLCNVTCSDQPALVRETGRIMGFGDCRDVEPDWDADDSLGPV